MQNKKKLLYPEWKIRVGEYVLRRGIQVESVSSREAHADWCVIGLAMELKDKINVAHGDVTIVQLGYDDDYDCIMSGRIIKNDQSDWSELMVKDDMVRLENLEVKGTFMDCTPQDIIRYIMVSAGIEKYELATTEYGKQGRLAMSSRNGIDAVKAVNASWGIDNLFYIRNGVFYWGVRTKQNYVYTLDDGNILGISKLGTLWETATLGVPWVHHSDLIKLNHTKLSGMFEVEKVIIKSDNLGCVRQYIYFKGG